MKLQEEAWVQEVGLVGVADYFDTRNILAKTIGRRQANKHI